ncbi:hypothetical protein ACRJ4B_49905 [Streptomyces sp. GTA36]
MSRALGIVAEACAAVIAAEVQAACNLTASQARAVGRSSVAALRGDGWHITAGPAPEPSPASAQQHPGGTT